MLERLELDTRLDDLVERLDARPQVRLRLEHLDDPHAPDALDPQAVHAVLGLQHAQDPHRGSELVEVTRSGFVDLGIPRRDGHEQPVARQRVVDQPLRALGRREHRGDQHRVEHGIPERQHRKALRQVRLGLSLLLEDGFFGSHQSLLRLHGNLLDHARTLGQCHAQQPRLE